MNGSPCRETIRHLSDWTDRPTESVAGDPHLRCCLRCARRVDQARRVARLLRGMEPLAAPDALAADRVLSRVEAEVCDERTIGDALRAALPPMRMPFEVSVEAGIVSGASGRQVSGLLLHGLPRRKGPAWVWARVRADLRAWLDAERSASRRKLTRWLVGAAVTAAAVIVAATLETKVVTPPRLQAQIVDVEDPYDPSMSPARIMAEAAQRPAERK